MAQNGKLDMALEDIIKQAAPTNGNRRGRGRGSRPAGRGRPTPFRGAGRRTNDQSISFNKIGNTPEGRWAHDRFNDMGGGHAFELHTASSAMNSTAKLLISNLDFGVSDNDIKELFSEFGPLRRAAVHYDKSGRSLGSADVVFERRADASRAVKQYNGVPLDGRPMKIQLVNVNSSSNEVPAASNFRNNRIRGFNAGRRDSPPSRRNRGTGGRGGGGIRGKQPDKKPVTQEQLDADLDAYINKME